jgi:SAM-dependent methyltransferase
MNWQEAQNLENDFWKSIARGLSHPPALLEHLGHLAEALNFVDPRKIAKPTDRLIEIGIGPLGIGSAVMQFPDLKIIGVDPLPKIAVTTSDNLLNAYVQHLAGRIEYIQAQAEKLPFGEGEFDIVVSHNCIDHCESAMDILKEAVRVLKPGGRFILTVNTFSFAGRAKFELMRRLQPKKPIHVQHPWTFTHGRILERLSEFGLEVVAHQGGHGSLIGRARLSRFLTVKKAV